MSVLRGILFDNLGLKLVALLLAVVVYLNVYTDRPASMVVSFPIVVTDLPDSLAVVGLTPQAVAAELRGTGKQLIRLRVSEPPIKVSLAGVEAGRFERSLGPEDLPLPAGAQIQVDRMARRRDGGQDVMAVHPLSARHAQGGDREGVESRGQKANGAVVTEVPVHERCLGSGGS